MAEDSPFTSDLFEREDGSVGALGSSSRVLDLDPPPASRPVISAFVADTLPARGRILELSGSAARIARGSGDGAGWAHPACRLDLDLDGGEFLPFRDESLDGVLLVGALPLLTRPLETFREVQRILRPGAPFVSVAYPAELAGKAVRIWCRAQTARERLEIGMAYFRFSGGWVAVHGVDLDPRGDTGVEVIAVFGRRGGTVGRRIRAAGWGRYRG